MRAAARAERYFLRNFHSSISGLFTGPPLRCALDVIGVDRILFADDHPFGNATGGRRYLDEARIGEDERAKIAYRNAGDRSGSDVSFLIRR